MNNVTLIGRLTKAPQTSQPNDTERSFFTLAINRGPDIADFIPVVCFAGTARTVGDHLTKGSRVAVEGHLRSSSYERDGETIYALEVVARSVTFLDPRPAEVPSPS